MVIDIPFCSKPLAAYRLGLLSRTCRKWRDLCLKMPEFEYGTAKGVWLVFVHLNEALLALIGEIPQHVYGELRPFLQRQQERWETVSQMVWKYNAFRNEPWDAGLLTRVGTTSYTRLITLADATCDKLGGKTWCALGAAVGNYELQLFYNHDVDKTPPSLDQIVRLAQELLPMQVNRIPVLEAMVRLAATLPQKGTRAFLTEVVRTARHTPAEVDDSASLHEAYGSDWDGFVVEKLISDFDTAIQESLGGLDESEGDQFNTAIQESLDGIDGSDKGIATPIWDKTIYVLRMGNRVIRKVRPVAAKVIQILDEFQASGWRERIEDPLGRDGNRKGDQQRLHDTIRSLNKGLKQIRFIADGTGEGIRWQQV